MPSPSTGERGFSLLEVLVCVGMLAAAGAATAGAFAAVARNAAPADLRDAALAVGENALVRARAAIAYAPATADGTLPPDRSWALRSGETNFGAGVRVPARCGASDALVVPVAVAATYDPAIERFTVVVTYPRDPCAAVAGGTIAPDNAARVSLAATLGPSLFAPGRIVVRDIAPPARM